MTSPLFGEKSLKPPFVWKVQISFTKAVETILQLFQNQETYQKDQMEKSVISHLQSLRQTYSILQNVEFTPCWHFLLSAFVADYCAQSAGISYFKKTGKNPWNSLELSIAENAFSPSVWSEKLLMHSLHKSITTDMTTYSFQFRNISGKQWLHRTDM